MASYIQIFKYFPIIGPNKADPITTTGKSKVELTLAKALYNKTHTYYGYIYYFFTEIYDILPIELPTFAIVWDFLLIPKVTISMNC